MQILIQPEVKLKIASFGNSNYQVKEKSINSKFGLDLKFYQKLFTIFLSLCAFLIFPESPQHAEVLCNKHHSKESCRIW